MMKITTQKFSIRLIFVGLVIIVLSLILFLWKETFVDIGSKINSEKIAQYGDFIGGIVGSIFSLAGVVLFFVALKEQREDFKTNTEVLQLQKQELILQRKELEETRGVFEEQSKLMLKQQNDATFFNLLANHRQMIESLKQGRPKPIPGSRSNKMERYLTEAVSGYEILDDIYNDLYEYIDYWIHVYVEKRFDRQIVLNVKPIEMLIKYVAPRMVFNSITHLVNYIEEKFEEKDKEFYLETLKASLTDAEKFFYDAYIIHNVNPFKEKPRDLGFYSNELNFGYKNPNDWSVPLLNINHFASKGDNGKGGVTVRHDDKTSVFSVKFHFCEENNPESFKEIQIQNLKKGESDTSVYLEDVFPNKYFEIEKDDFTHLNNYDFYLVFTLLNDERNYNIVFKLNLESENRIGIKKRDRIRMNGNAAIVEDLEILNRLIEIQ